MESNQLFEAEAALAGGEVEQGESGHVNGNGNDTGVRATIAGNGGYDKHLVSVTAEESPLLPSGSGSSSGEDDEGAAVTQWPGATDFEGLPWWKTPSVSLHSTLGLYLR